MKSTTTYIMYGSSSRPGKGNWTGNLEKFREFHEKSKIRTSEISIKTWLLFDNILIPLIILMGLAWLPVWCYLGFWTWNPEKSYNLFIFLYFPVPCFQELKSFSARYLLFTWNPSHGTDNNSIKSIWPVHCILELATLSTPLAWFSPLT